MLIADHINLLGDNPLIGPNDDTARRALPGHVRAVRCRRCATLARAVAPSQGITLREGVYVAVAGPNLETRAEYRMLRALRRRRRRDVDRARGDRRACTAGMRVLGLSIITDLCLPDALEPAELATDHRRRADAPSRS